MDAETTLNPEGGVQTRIGREISSLQEKIKIDTSKVELLCQSPLAEAACGLPEGKTLPDLIDRVKERLGKETDIISNLTQIGLDIFSKDLSGQKLRVRGGKLIIKEGQAAIEDRHQGKWGGYADPDSLEAVVLLPEGLNRQNYLYWAVTGDYDYLWAFSSAVHEATHQGFNPGRVHLYEREAMQLALVSTVLALSESVSVIAREHFWPRSVSKEEWIFLAATYTSALVFGYGSMAIDTFRHAGSSNNNVIAKVVDEALAHLSRSDIGADKLWKGYSLSNSLAHAHPTYISNWQSAVKLLEGGVDGENALNEMVDRLVVKYAALSGLGMTAFEINKFLRQKRNIPGPVRDPKAWIDALEQLISDRAAIKYGEPVSSDELTRFGQLKIEERCVAMRKIFLEEMIHTTEGIWVNPSSQAFSIENRLCLLCPGVGEVRQWVELDYRLGEASLGYVANDFHDASGPPVSDSSDLGKMVSFLVDSFTPSDWGKVEESIRSEMFPQFENLDDDASGGQLSLAILMEVFRRIPSRWGIDEEMTDQWQMWSRFAHDYLSLARERLNRARTLRLEWASDTNF